MRRVNPKVGLVDDSWSPIGIAYRAGLSLSIGVETILRAFGGDSLNEYQLKMFRRLTGTTWAKPRVDGYRELWVQAGRRSGKTTRLGATVAVSAAVQDVGHLLSPGEYARVIVVCPTLGHSTQAFDSIKGILEVLGVAYRERAREVIITGRRTVIQAVVADHISPRGGTAIAAIVDEAALLPTSEGAAGYDVEILAAIRPALATTDGKLVVISTPWDRKGVHFETCSKFYGKVETAKLVIHGTTWDLNPSLTEAKCRELEVDPKRFRREYQAVPGDTDENFLRRNDVLGCVDRGIEVRPATGESVYVLGLDIGLRRDRTAVVVAHREYRSVINGPPADMIVIDAIRTWTPKKGEKLPFDEIIGQVASMSRQYNGAKIVRDFWGGDAVESALRERGVISEEKSMAPKSQAARFAVLSQKLQSGRIRLVDCPLAIEELCDLRVKLHSGGRFEIAAPDRRGAHDDIADALALACEAAAGLMASGDIRCRVTACGYTDAGVYCDRQWEQRIIDSQGERWVPGLPPRGTMDWEEARMQRRAEGISIPEDFEDCDPLDGNPFGINIPVHTV